MRSKSSIACLFWGACVGFSVLPRFSAAQEIRLELTATPSSLVLEEGHRPSVRLTIHVAAAVGTLSVADLMIHSTGGAVVDLKQSAPSLFEATLLPPEEIFPQLVVVTVVASPSDRQAIALTNTVVAYSSRIQLKGRTEGMALMRIRVGDRAFGPVQADAEGRFVIPVEIPPGEGWASAISQDELGNTAHSRINLYLPSVRTVHGFMHPAQYVADGKDSGRIFITTVDSKGAPVDTSLQVRAKLGSVEAPVQRARGLYELAYTAPAGVGEGYDIITIAAASALPVKIAAPLLHGAPYHVNLLRPPPMLVADGQSSGTFLVRVEDEHGNPVLGQHVEVVADQGILETIEQAGVYSVTLTPRSTARTENIVVRVTPRAPQCIRPTLYGDEDAFYLMDCRSLPCWQHVAVINAQGEQLLAGAPQANGRLPKEMAPYVNEADLHLGISDPDGTKIRTGLRAREGQRPMDMLEPLELAVTATWRLPAPFAMQWSEVSQVKDGFRIGILAPGERDLAERIQVVASAGSINYLETINETAFYHLRLPGDSPSDSIHVAAVDMRTGVSLHLRLP